jgi:3-dehydro-4-phosphotetronate decarboxylase
VSDDDAIRAEVCRVGQSLFARGYAHASAGNISVRVDGGFLITPTDACLGTLEPDGLAAVTDAGVQISGERASKTLELHRCIYAADPDARCVLHTHATHLVALTVAGVWPAGGIIPPLTPYFVMKVGRVPLIPYRRPGDPDVANLVTATIRAGAQAGHPIRAVMLDRLGPTIWHGSPAEAMATLEELEETAHLWWLTRRSARPLDDAAIDELRRVFAARW